MYWPWNLLNVHEDYRKGDVCKGEFGQELLEELSKVHISPKGLSWSFSIFLIEIINQSIGFSLHPPICKPEFPCARGSCTRTWPKCEGLTDKGNSHVHICDRTLLSRPCPEACVNLHVNTPVLGIMHVKFGLLKMGDFFFGIWLKVTFNTYQDETCL